MTFVTNGNKNKIKRRFEKKKNLIRATLLFSESMKLNTRRLIVLTDITHQVSDRAQMDSVHRPPPPKEAAKIVEVAGSRFTPYTSDVQKQ